MMQAQYKESIAQWRACLDELSRWSSPCEQYKYLIRWADRLQVLGEVDPLERFDMAELALAAFCHYIEDQPQDWLHPASEYNIFNQAMVQVGSLRGHRYFLHGAEVTPGPMDFFAQIQQRDGEKRIITRTYCDYGVVRDRYILTNTGQRLVLVETARRINGQMRVRIDDPDFYRAVVDQALVALEEGDMAHYVELWEKENFSVFKQCSQCCDRFDLREDCRACDGRGFVEDPQCPSKLPFQYQRPLLEPTIC